MKMNEEIIDKNNEGLGEYVILLMAIGKQESITFTLKRSYPII